MLPFLNRSEAGRALAQALMHHAGRGDVLVLALPRGGVPVAFEVANALNVPLDLMLVRKLGTPGQPELAMGAIAQNGVRVMNPELVSMLRISEDAIAVAERRERKELERRQRVYRGKRLPPDLHGKRVILIDDGLATGATMRSGAPYSTWNNGMERSITYFHNAIGLLTEITGHPTPSRIALVPDNQLPRNDLPAPIAPQTWRFRQSIDYSLSINRAVLDYASRNRDRLLFNIWRMGANAIARGETDTWRVTPSRIDALKAAAGQTGRTADPALYDKVLRDPALRDPRAYVIPADQADLPTAIAFLNSLIKTGVDVDRATRAFSIAGTSYPAGSFVVRTNQAYRPHVLDMFEPQDHPHDLRYPGGPPVLPYDATGYTLALQMGVRFDRILDPFEAPLERVPDLIAVPAGKIRGRGDAGFVVDHAAINSFILSNRLLKAGQPVFWQKTEVRLGARTLALAEAKGLGREVPTEWFVEETTP